MINKNMTIRMFAQPIVIGWKYIQFLKVRKVVLSEIRYY